MRRGLVATARTVDSCAPVHSLHAYPLRPASRPIYEVDRLRDGRSFTTRRVVAIQHGEAIFNLQASFHGDEAGPTFQHRPPTDVPPPESLADYPTRMERHRERLGSAVVDRQQPIDLRFVGPDPLSRDGTGAESQEVWLRAAGTLPDDPVIHACVVTYASDMTLLDTATLPFGIGWDTPGVRMASLDHDVVPSPFPPTRAALQPAGVSVSSRGLAGGSISPPTANCVSGCRKA